MKLRTLIGHFSPRWREPSICEACGGPFVCGATVLGCWCAQVQTSPAVRERLRAQYRKCLCQACLERFAEADRAQLKVDDCQ